MNKKTKFISMLALLCVAANTTLVSAKVDTPSVLSTVKTYASEVMPRTYYLSYGEILYQQRDSSTMTVKITTAANTFADSIYHDVVIYKNGSLAYSGRLSDTEITSLSSPINISAKSGDFFSTYVTHYVSHNGITEHMDTHKDQYF